MSRPGRTHHGATGATGASVTLRACVCVSPSAWVCGWARGFHLSGPSSIGTPSAATSRAVAAAISATAPSNASAFRTDGLA